MQDLKSDAVKAWQTISREETHDLATLIAMLLLKAKSEL